MSIIYPKNGENIKNTRLGGREYMQSRQERRKNRFESRSIIGNLANIYEKIMYGEVKTEEEVILDSIREAHEEWRNAEAYFQNVTDPDLIDHAIYRMEAARTRYTYLLKLAREMGIEGERINM